MRIGIAVMSSRLGQGGGVNVHNRNLVEALADYGSAHTFVILISEGAADAWSFRKWPGHVQFKILKGPGSLSIPARGWQFLLRRLAPVTSRHANGDFVARQIDRLGLDLIHFPATLIDPLSIKTPCVVTFADLQQEFFPEFFTREVLVRRRRTYRPSVEKAVRVIVPSRFTAHTLVEKFGTSSAKIHIIHHGLPGRFVPAELSEIDRVKAKYNLPDTFIYYPANPWQHKNHARLMAGLRIYRDRFGEVPWLVLSGRLPNEDRDALSLAIAAGVENRVMDLEFVDIADLPGLYSAATLMVFPSLFEGFGIPLVEAMACGCPIVAANATTIPEVTGGAALLFDPFDPVDIAATLYRAVNDPDLRGTLAATGASQLQRFDWKSIIDQHNVVYAQAVQESRTAVK